jgi:hypothetical protein
MKKQELDEKGILYKWVQDCYGQRCKHFEDSCACCVAWGLYDRLVQIEPLVQKSKEKK